MRLIPRFVPSHVHQPRRPDQARDPHDRGHRGRPRPARIVGRGRGDEGQAGLGAGVLVLAVALVACALLAAYGGAQVERTRARTAADAAALAGAVRGESAASEVAVANGARVEQYRTLGTTVEVTVVVGDTRATSRAAPSGSPSTR